MTRVAERPSTFERWLVEENSWDQRHDDREYVPALSAMRFEEEPWRIDRLARVYATARALFILVEQRPLPATIVAALHDQRGQLIVTVASDDWWQLLEMVFRLAWRSESENAENVARRVADGAR